MNNKAVDFKIKITAIFFIIGVMGILIVPMIEEQSLNLAVVIHNFTI